MSTLGVEFYNKIPSTDTRIYTFLMSDPYKDAIFYAKIKKNKEKNKNYIQLILVMY